MYQLPRSSRLLLDGLEMTGIQSGLLYPLGISTHLTAAGFPTPNRVRLVTPAAAVAAEPR